VRSLGFARRAALKTVRGTARGVSILAKPKSESIPLCVTKQEAPQCEAFLFQRKEAAENLQSFP
jgi:hypothetical protein